MLIAAPGYQLAQQRLTWPENVAELRIFRLQPAPVLAEVKVALTGGCGWNTRA